MSDDLIQGLVDSAVARTVPDHVLIISLAVAMECIDNHRDFVQEMGKLGPPPLDADRVAPYGNAFLHALIGTMLGDYGHASYEGAKVLFTMRDDLDPTDSMIADLGRRMLVKVANNFLLPMMRAAREGEWDNTMACLAVLELDKILDEFTTVFYQLALVCQEELERRGADDGQTRH